MKIAVWVNEGMNPGVGGGYSYTQKLIRLIDQFKFDANLEICFIATAEGLNNFEKEFIQLPSKENWNDSASKSKRVWNQWFTKDQKGVDYNQHLLNLLEKNQIDLIYYPTQMQRMVPDFPFLSTNWDIGHLSMPYFPETHENGQIEKRTRWYNHILPLATAVFVESEAGKKELIHHLNYDSDKIYVVPLFAGELQHLAQEEVANINRKFDLVPQSFFMYPAQFWKHKNHHNLVKAFAAINKNHKELQLVLTGSDKGQLESVLNLAKELSIEDQVRYLGFVDAKELFALYKSAVALVLPTRLGPTNMPPLEARQLGCPVLCSDFTGHREQLQDGALYFDPENISEITAAMNKILDPKFREALIKKAEARLSTSKFEGQHAILAINEHFSSISRIYQRC